MTTVARTKAAWTGVRQWRCRYEEWGKRRGKEKIAVVGKVRTQEPPLRLLILPFSSVTTGAWATSSASEAKRCQRARAMISPCPPDGRPSEIEGEGLSEPEHSAEPDVVG